MVSLPAEPQGKPIYWVFWSLATSPFVQMEYYLEDGAKRKCVHACLCVCVVCQGVLLAPSHLPLPWWSLLKRVEPESYWSGGSLKSFSIWLWMTLLLQTMWSQNTSWGGVRENWSPSMEKEGGKMGHFELIELGSLSEKPWSGLLSFSAGFNRQSSSLLWVPFRLGFYMEKI